MPTTRFTGDSNVEYDEIPNKNLPTPEGWPKQAFQTKLPRGGNTVRLSKISKEN